MSRWGIEAVAVVLAAMLVRAATRAGPRARARSTLPPVRRRVPAPVREPLARALADAQLDLTPEDAVVVGLVATIASALLAAALAPPLAVPVAAGAAMAGPMTLVLARGRGRRRFVAALPGFVDLVAARLRSGHTLLTALADAADARDPVAVDARRILRRVEHGDPVVSALAWWADERGDPAVRAVAGALAVAATTGGGAADALEGLARSLRDQQGARAEAAALSAQARMSAVVVGAAPFAYLAFSAAVDPGAARVLVATPVGRVCLVLGIGLDALGALWMRRIVRSEP